MTTETEQINKIFEIAKKNQDGFTIDSNFKKVKVKKGYAVSLTNNTDINLWIAIKNILEIKETYFKNRKDIYIGGWYDIDTELFYIDLSVIIKDKKTALKTARIFKQIAVFDFSVMDSIKVL